MRWNVFAVALAMAFALIGCTDVTPTVGMLKVIEGFDFKSSKLMTASLSHVSLQASCSSFIEAIELSFDGTSWIQPTAYDPAAKSMCDNGSFAITLSNSQAPWNAMSFANGQLITVKFRARSRIGNWIYRTVEIKYAPSTTISQEVLAGSQVQSNLGAAIVLRGRLRAQTQTVATGGAYKIRGRILQ